MLFNSKPEDGIIYILCPVHNRRDITEMFVRCLLAQSESTYHLVLIDDGSTDGTSDMVKSLMANATILKGDGNLWWAGSLQKAYLWLQGRKLIAQDIVLIINDDVRFGPQYLTAGRKLIRDYPEAMICSQYFDQASGALLDSGAKCNFENLEITSAYEDKEVAFLSTRGLFLRAADFLGTGGFYPEKLPHYLSDYEFTFRANKILGLKFRTSPQIPVFGLAETSGISNLKKMSPRQALSCIFTQRFHQNPIYYCHFIELCYPREKHFKLKLTAWIRAALLWTESFHSTLKFMFLFSYHFLFLVMRGFKYILKRANGPVNDIPKVERSANENKYHFISLLNFSGADEVDRYKKMTGFEDSTLKLEKSELSDQTFTLYLDNAQSRSPEILDWFVRTGRAILGSRLPIQIKAIGTVHALTKSLEKNSDELLATEVIVVGHDAGFEDNFVETLSETLKNFRGPLLIDRLPVSFEKEEFYRIGLGRTIPLRKLKDLLEHYSFVPQIVSRIYISELPSDRLEPEVLSGLFCPEENPFTTRNKNEMNMGQI